MSRALLCLPMCLSVRERFRSPVDRCKDDQGLHPPRHPPKNNPKTPLQGCQRGSPVKIIAQLGNLHGMFRGEADVGESASRATGLEDRVREETILNVSAGCRSIYSFLWVEISSYQGPCYGVKTYSDGSINLTRVLLAFSFL